MINFFSVTLFAILLKLSSSVDDAFWLSKLVHSESKSNRIVIEFTYIIALVTITLASYFIYLIGSIVIGYLIDNENFLPIISSLILIIFSLTYLRKDHKKEVNTSTSIALKQKIYTAFTISIIGSIDELLLFITLLSTKKITIVPLLVGTIIAAGIIILIVGQITNSKMIMSFLDKIPIWMVIFIIGLATLAYSLYKLLG